MGVMIDRLKIPMPDIRTLAAVEARIIMAFRLAIIAYRTDHEYRTRLHERLGSRLAATRLLIIVEMIGFAWPEPFQIGCPCSPNTTPDEILFLNMLRQAIAGNRRGFDSLLCEMLHEDARDRLFTDIRHFADAYLETGPTT